MCTLLHHWCHFIKLLVSTDLMQLLWHRSWTSPVTAAKDGARFQRRTNSLAWSFAMETRSGNGIQLPNFLFNPLPQDQVTRKNLNSEYPRHLGKTVELRRICTWKKQSQEKYNFCSFAPSVRNKQVWSETCLSFLLPSAQEAAKSPPMSIRKRMIL